MGSKSSKKKVVEDDLDSITAAIKTKVVTDADTPDRKQVALETLWKQHKGPTIIVVFRRWGCVICRLGATEISELRTLFDERYGKDIVGFYGVGFEMVGYEDFKKKQFFKGKLYIDEGKTIYKSLNYAPKSLTALVNAGTRKRAKTASQKGIKGDMKGDGFQLGGTMIVAPTGEVIFHKRQKYYGDDPTEEELISCIETYFTVLGVPKK